ncbi:hypothetical protein N7462_008454 [Penicillium macrosclerotiorum]|uniref:uncharacterized protein n=1 Tax=Penicillium macrosclerotiorum TaxID=303699 RepID=UPI00254773B1|nr:uncharacterized protein N7462_008454 [Penicillium macrosclerotiorum]KAJ5675557.1 hypothetical protein N7462_008454 [Penicillium macrosclerotiorum]
MANIMKKFKKKRARSSELHDRWGDTSISHPTEGSWNQLNQPPGSIGNNSTNDPPQLQTSTRRYVPIDSASPVAAASNGFIYRSIEVDPAIPRGYFDENIRHPTQRRNQSPMTGLGISDHHRPRMGSPHTLSDNSCDEYEVIRHDVCAEPGEAQYLQPFSARDRSRTPRRDDPYSRVDPSMRPAPLAVTQRMRNLSGQSPMTETPISASGTVSSGLTSHTALSSISGHSSTPPGTPRVSVKDKHSFPRPRNPEPDPIAESGMVPSYDELYG